RRTILSILLVLPIRPVAGLLAIRTATMTPMLLVRALACLGGHAFRNSRSAFGTGRRLHLGAAMSLMWPAWRPALAVRTSARAPHLDEIRLRGLGLGRWRLRRNSDRLRWRHGLSCSGLSWRGLGRR